MGRNVNMIPSAVPTNLERKGTEKEKASPVPSKVRREGYRGRKSLTCTLGNRKGRVQRKKKSHLYPQKSEGRVQRNKNPQKLKRGAMLINLPFKIVSVILPYSK